MTLIDGKAVSEQVKQEIAAEVAENLLAEEIPERQITLVEDSGKPQSIAVQKLLTYFK